jgi:hypothetical protein
MPLLAVTSLSGFLSGLVVATTSAPAGASPVQTAGDDTSAWQPGWNWTYNEEFTINDPGTGFFQIGESVKYTVQGIVSHTNYTCPTSYTGGVCNSSTPGATPVGTYQAYQVNFSGGVTSGTGTADGETLSVQNGASGTTGSEWLEVGNLASVETDQTQTIVGTAVGGLETVTINLVNDDVYTPAQVNEDFRLHSGDQWLENTSVYDSGVVSYVGTGAESLSGTDPIDSYGPINATATSTSTTASPTIAANIPVDSVNYNDVTDLTSDTQAWSNTYHNIVLDNFLTGLPQGQTCSSAATATCEDETKNLTAASTPAPSTAVTEAIAGTTSGLACGGQVLTVSGALSNGSASAVAIGVDESTITPGHFVTTNTTSSSPSGAYSATIVAPNLADGLNKPGVNGTFGVTVTSGAATNVLTLEVSPQDCTTTTYNGATTAAVGTSAAVSALVKDQATGAPVSGGSVTFSMTGQAGTVTANTGANGIATANLPITATPSGTPYTLTASYAGGPIDTASSGTSPFTVTLDPTSTTLTASETTATIGDLVTFTAQVSPTGPAFGSIAAGATVSFTINGAPIGSPVPVSGTGSATSAALNTATLAVNTYNIVATYSGNTDYATSSGALPAYSVHNPLTPTTTTLAVVPSGSVFGQTETLTATVSPTVDNTNNAVSFFDGSTLLGTSTLSGGSPDTATFTTSSLAVGGHSLTADYNGDNNVQFAPSNSNPVSVTIAIAPTTTTIALSTPPGTPVAFQPVTYSVTVAGPAGDTAVPTGQVQVAINGVNQGGPLTLSGGSASISDSAGLPAGTNSITATYVGTTNFSTSSGSLAQAVDQATTATSLVSSTGTTGSVVNQPVTFTANVSPQAGGNPTGTVTFFDCPTTAPCSTVIGTSNLSPTGSAGAQATLQLSSLSIGDNYITASYGGDGNFTGSSSAPPFDQVVSPPPPTAATSTALTSSESPANSSPNTSVFGQMVTFTATVSVGALQDAVNAPAGTVQFSVDGNNLGGPVTLSGGTGSQTTGWTATASVTTTSALLAGGHSVIATYSGLSGAGIPQAFEGSGDVITQEVQQSGTTATGSSSANPASFGQSVTFKVVLSATAPGVGTPGGSVQFRLNGAPFGAPVTVSGGTATSGAATGLLPGTYTVSYVTSGDANFLGTSGSFTFVVSSIPTVTTLTATPNPVIFGQPLTLVATVTHTTGPGNPTGTVTFKDGSTVLSTQTVANGTGTSSKASFTTSLLATGTHSITASYSGDPDFGVSVSGPVTVTVTAGGTKVVARAAVLTYNLANLLTPNGVLSLGPLFATLTTAAGVPIAGQTLVFSAVASPGGPVVCSGVTNALGVATCTPTLAGSLEVDLTGGFTATYAGNGSYTGSNGSAGLISITL